MTDTDKERARCAGFVEELIASGVDCEYLPQVLRLIEAGRPMPKTIVDRWVQIERDRCADVVVGHRAISHDCGKRSEVLAMDIILLGIESGK